VISRERADQIVNEMQDLALAARVADGPVTRRVYLTGIDVILTITAQRQEGIMIANVWEWAQARAREISAQLEKEIGTSRHPADHVERLEVAKAKADELVAHLAEPAAAEPAAPETTAAETTEGADGDGEQTEGAIETSEV
jgi:hypothetical protein